MRTQSMWATRTCLRGLYFPQLLFYLGICNFKTGTTHTCTSVFLFHLLNHHSHRKPSCLSCLLVCQEKTLLSTQSCLWWYLCDVTCRVTQMSLHVYCYFDLLEVTVHRTNYLGLALISLLVCKVNSKNCKTRSVKETRQVRFECLKWQFLNTFILPCLQNLSKYVLVNCR